MSFASLNLKGDDASNGSPLLRRGVIGMVVLFAGMAVISLFLSPTNLNRFALAMCTALVYYAEHYVVDVLAGALLAVLVLVGCQLWENSRDRARVLIR